MSELHEQTRAVYHDQHDRLRLDEKARARIHGMYTEEYFGLGPGWFKGKTAADVGCGNMAVLAIRLAQFGARHVTLADLGDEWMPSARAELERDRIEPHRFTLKAANVLDLSGFEKGGAISLAATGFSVTWRTGRRSRRASPRPPLCARRAATTTRRTAQPAA